MPLLAVLLDLRDAATQRGHHCAAQGVPALWELQRDLGHLVPERADRAEHRRRLGGQAGHAFYFRDLTIDMVLGVGYAELFWPWDAVHVLMAR